MYYRLYQYAMRTDQAEAAKVYLEKAVESLSICNLLLLEQTKGDPNKIVVSPSFFMGPAGIYTLGALIYSQID